ncbi:helix-turn-helix transcriptional regulator [Stenotrophomonas indicatrix]|uniref:helix-turn-helix transcriptional regulator n=1 Tax=Stenotrophomonas indicatrix TaxID=2045451 RepID=UPI003CE5AE58
MERGTFPPKQKVGGGTRWYQSDIQRWIRARRNAPQWTPKDAGQPRPTATAAERKRSPSGHRAGMA